MSNTPPLVLIIEDEVAIRDMVSYILELDSFSVITAENMQVALNLLQQQQPDVILLDWMLPGTSGIEIIRLLKQHEQTRNIPIIMLTAKAEEENKIKGLNTGADDYIVKPFSAKELVARIKAVLRRGTLLSPDNKLILDRMVINHAMRQVTIDEQPLHLTSTLYRLLYYLVTHKNHTYSRAQLLDHVWAADKNIDERTVDVQIRRLRDNLKQYGYDKYLVTVRGVGYQWLWQ